MGGTGTGNGKVVVNRAMSLDGFIAGPGHAMDSTTRSGAVTTLRFRVRTRIPDATRRP